MTDEEIKSRIRTYAQNNLASDDLEIEEGADVSLNDDDPPGAWVACWVFVADYKSLMRP
jgi:hypothetical protein